jgi:hypothetical protein
MDPMDLRPGHAVGLDLLAGCAECCCEGLPWPGLRDRSGAEREGRLPLTGRGKMRIGDVIVEAELERGVLNKHFDEIDVEYGKRFVVDAYFC